MVRQCVACGGEFRPSWIGQRYCCIACEPSAVPEEYRTQPPPMSPECREQYHRELGQPEPAWVTEELAPPPLAWE
jgi:hypothetical protein